MTRARTSVRSGERNTSDWVAQARAARTAVGQFGSGRRDARLQLVLLAFRLYRFVA